jgi:methyl-accepting chemotaxis protein
MSLHTRAKAQIAFVGTIVVSTLLGQFVSNGFTLTQLDQLGMQLAISTVLGFFIAVIVMRFLLRAYTALAAQLQAIQNGKTPANQPLSVTGDPVVEQICRHYNDRLQQQTKSLQSLAATTNELAFTASKLAEVTERTEANTRQQQLETDQVAAAMNEMNATVEGVARNASAAAEAAEKANTASHQGEQVARDAEAGIDTLVNDIRNAAEVVSQLEQQSNDIGVVLEVIKNIAEQTNLLALNAAIEAARAGEQGRGFAVVADEVRTLATRTQSSAREIEQMIGRLQGGVHDAVAVMEVALDKGRDGSGKVHNTLGALNDILNAVGIINDMNAQIATAAEEQSQVTNEINRNINAIAHIADQTTQDARESRNTSVSLADISQQIQQWVGQLGSGQSSLDLSSAKAAHLNWKTKLRAFLDGKSSLSQEQAVSHRHCDFGKWYYSDGLSKFGHLHALRDVEKPHEELHELIRIIIDLKQHGRTQEAEQAYRNVARLSDEIVAHLNTAEQEASHS